MFVFCGQKEKKGLESNSFMSILDGLEGKKSQVVWEWGAFSSVF